MATWLTMDGRALVLGRNGNASGTPAPRRRNGIHQNRRRQRAQCFCRAQEYPGKSFVAATHLRLKLYVIPKVTGKWGASYPQPNDQNQTLTLHPTHTKASQPPETPKPSLALLEHDHRFGVFPEFVFYDFMQPVKLPGMFYCPLILCVFSYFPIHFLSYGHSHDKQTKPQSFVIHPSKSSSVY